MDSDKLIEILIADASVVHQEIVTKAVGDTPIEQAFMFGLLYRCCWEWFPYHIQSVSGLGDAACLAAAHPRRALCVFPQLPVQDYRPDFILGWARVFQEPSSTMFMAIECDGHDFHERTKAQAQRDKSKDRSLLQINIPVLRFTGAELHSKPLACAHEALAFFLKARVQQESAAAARESD